MGKKRAVRAGDDSSGKTRLEIRLDNDVFDRIQELADEAQVSVNQLMQGLARWAGGKLQVGEPDRDEDGYISGTRAQPGCLWAGELEARGSFSKDEKQNICDEFEDDPLRVHEIIEGGKRDPQHKGKVWIFLDFTERRVVREE